MITNELIVKLNGEIYAVKGLGDMWQEIILGILALIGTIWGGASTWYLRKESKRSAKLDNDNKVAESWKALYEKALETQYQLKEDVEREKARNDELHDKEDALHDTVSCLKEMKDTLSTKCAVAELLICKELNCPKRNPPLGSQVFAAEFAEEAARDTKKNEAETLEEITE